MSENNRGIFANFLDSWIDYMVLFLSPALTLFFFVYYGESIGIPIDKIGGGMGMAVGAWVCLSLFWLTRIDWWDRWQNKSNWFTVPATFVASAVIVLLGGGIQALFS